ncbi:MAG: hypothetical protein R3C62_08445 [Chloroflexota bacterium]
MENKQEEGMNLNAPKNTTFYVALVLAVLGLLGTIVTIPVVTGMAFWFVILGFIVLAAGNLVSGL